MKTKKIAFSAGVVLLLLGAFFASVPARKSVEAGPRPTKINITTMDEEGMANYYSQKGLFSNVKGDELLSKLNNVIKGHTEYDYESTSDRLIYKIIDRNWSLSPLTESQLNNFNYDSDNPYIVKLYADYNHDISKADRFKNAGASRVSFDKEHIWAQSHGNFGRSYGAGSDIHALWPSDVIGNQNAHGDNNFGVPQSSLKSYNNDKGTYVGRNGSIPGGADKVFEPLDEFKGDIARALMYMPARYYTYEDVTHPKLELVNGSPGGNTASASTPGRVGDLKTLLEWHLSDPVSEYEIKRNNLIYYNYQGNRNPFIDHPEWAKIAYDASYSGAGASSGDGAVLGDSLQSLTIENAPTKLKLFEDYKFTDLKVYANYKERPREDITNHSNLTLTLIDTAKLGTQTISASFTDQGVSKHAAVSVLVTNEGVLVGNTELPATDLFISEYIKGSSQNKGLEIYNGTGEDVNLSLYSLKMFNNGGVTPNATLSLTGTLNNEETYTVTHTSAAPAIGDKASIKNGSITNYNGDDAIGLYKNDELIDVIGKIGEQVMWSGSAANGVTGSTLDNTLVRTSKIKSPTTTFDFLEWNAYARDTFTYFGVHTMELVTVGLDPTLQAEVWANYFLEVTGVYCEELDGASLYGSVWSSFKSEYLLMDTSSRAVFKGTPASSSVTEAKERYYYLVTKYETLKTDNFLVDENNNLIFSLVIKESKSNQLIALFFFLGLSLTFIPLIVGVGKKVKVSNKH